MTDFDTYLKMINKKYKNVLVQTEDGVRYIVIDNGCKIIVATFTKKDDTFDDIYVANNCKSLEDFMNLH